MSSRPRVGSTRSRSSRTSERESTARQYPDSEYGACFDPCAATASFFLYAQLNTITVLHHDSLAVERKFEKHEEEVKLICADNVSESGGGRQIASYDIGETLIIWDLFTGNDFARFTSFESIHAAAWMRDGNIAFGNVQGNIILFEPSTEEHLSVRTIFDPVTALAPASDCRTFAIGYKNGSILVATLQPNFTILHTLTTSRTPAPIVGLQWHGSSSKQKTDMLATQTSHGDLRVWSVSKVPHSEPPRVIRALGSPEIASTSRNWFAWSKNGRIINHSDGDTQAWDVRTKKMTSETVPTIDNVIALAIYGPTATLFTVGRNHTVQQYDLISKEFPVMVSNVQHVPPNAPPTPPDSIEEQKLPRTVPMKVLSSEPAALPIALDVDTSEDEGPVLSPLQKITQEMDELEVERERRDYLAPLSPVSSRASMSSASSYGRSRRRMQRGPSSASMRGSDGTTFSDQSSLRSGQDSMSIRSGSPSTSVRYGSPALRKDIMRAPEETSRMKNMDLFPFTRSRLWDVKFRPPQYPQSNVSADLLRKEMLNVVFGWPHDIENLIRDEQSRHRVGSAGGVLLSKWLGDSGADAMASMVASESMTSADWMLLALTVNMGQGPQRQIGEAFVRRSLEANEIHPAVAILLGLGSQNEAVEVYVSRKYYLEAVLLTCLLFPHDWQRQSHLIRRWGEAAISQGQPELAVRCFSCTSIESTEPWFSPKSQDLVYEAQQQAMAPESTRSPVSPPSAGSNRLTAKNASLKLITTFGDKGAPKPQEEINALGTTPIANTAITPGGENWPRPGSRTGRDQSQTRTATPGGFKRARFPSATRQDTTEGDTASESQQPRRRATPALDSANPPDTAIRDNSGKDFVGSPHPDAFNNARPRSRSRAESKDRNLHNLQIRMIPTVEDKGIVVSPSTTTASVASRGRHRRLSSGLSKPKHAISNAEDNLNSPSLSNDPNLKSFKGRNIDRYIESLEANFHAHQPLGDLRQRAESREARSRSRPGNRDPSMPRARSEVAYIPPSKHSPSSPKSMTAEDASKYATFRESDTDISNSITSPVASSTGRVRQSSKSAVIRSRGVSPEPKPMLPSGSRTGSRNASRTSNRQYSHDLEDPTRNEAERYRSGRHSPPSPAPMESTPVARSRQRSSSRRTAEGRARSTSRKPQDTNTSEQTGLHSPDMILENMGNARPRAYSRKELAAKELEDRRLSLARRTPIPHPGEQLGRSNLSSHSYKDSKTNTESYVGIERSQTAEAEVMQRTFRSKPDGTPTSPVAVGLPATPRAMRHPIDMHIDGVANDKIPAVPNLPDSFATLAPVSYQPGAKDADLVAPLLPSTVYSQRPPIKRSVSAPPENYNDPKNIARSSGREEANANMMEAHSRQLSERDFAPAGQSVYKGIDLPNIDTMLRPGDRTSTGEQIIVVGEIPNESPPVLAELAHLAEPPPPPPPPPPPRTLRPSPTTPGFPSGVINISMGGNGENSSSRSRYSPTFSDHAAPPTSTAATIRNRQNSMDSSVSSLKGGSKWRNMADRMRSGSRSRVATKSTGAFSPTADMSPQSPFQSTSNDRVLHSTGYSRARSPHQSAPYETVVDMSHPPPPPPPPHLPFFGVYSGQYGDDAETPTDLRTAIPSTSHYRTPREIRANMPPDVLQQGVYPPEHSTDVIEGGMI